MAKWVKATEYIDSALKGVELSDYEYELVKSALAHSKDFIQVKAAQWNSVSFMVSLEELAYMSLLSGLKLLLDEEKKMIYLRMDSDTYLIVTNRVDVLKMLSSLLPELDFGDNGELKSKSRATAKLST